MQVKSKQRVADHGEVFTAEREVLAMLDLVQEETTRIDSRFLEPACGDGNFLVEILRRKLTVVKRLHGTDFEHYALLAVSTLYGIDILQDNVHRCRERLLQ
jgi:type I restriction-modification system DNA methylase subunit